MRSRSTAPASIASRPAARDDARRTAAKSAMRAIQPQPPPPRLLAATARAPIVPQSATSSAS